MRFHWERLVVLFLFIPMVLASAFIQLPFVFLFYDNPTGSPMWSDRLYHWAMNREMNREKD